MASTSQYGRLTIDLVISFTLWERFWEGWQENACTLSLNIGLSIFSEPIQFGVACPTGSEKVVHGVKACVDEHWNDGMDFSVLKVDFKNAFNLVSRGAVLQECAKMCSLNWVAWCYSSHPFLCHPMGQLTSQSGVQQGDPLGPFLFALVLHKVAGAIKESTESAANVNTKLGISTMESLQAANLQFVDPCPLYRS